MYLATGEEGVGYVRSPFSGGILSCGETMCTWISYSEILLPHVHIRKIWKTSILAMSQPSSFHIILIILTTYQESTSWQIIFEFVAINSSVSSYLTFIWKELMTLRTHKNNFWAIISNVKSWIPYRIHNPKFAFFLVKRQFSIRLKLP